MTGLIKAGASDLAGRVRAFAPGGAGVMARPVDPELGALREQCLGLEAALAERDAQIDALAAKSHAAFTEGEAAGREFGKADADARREEAIALLSESAERATAAFEARLEALEALAPLLARICLEKLFGEQSERAALVRDLVRHQLDLLREETAIEVRVSAEDFDASTGTGIDSRCQIVVSDGLKSGDCSIRLELGTLEAGLDQQWGVLRTALVTMAEEGA